LLRRRGLGPADLIELLLKRELAQFVKRQAHEDADALIEHAETIGEGERLRGFRSLCLAGSAKPQWAVMGWPGQMGQASLAASSQTVNTKSSCGASGPANWSQDLERSFEMSKFDLRSTASASGLTASLG
jgi:hypothetical protein